MTSSTSNLRTYSTIAIPLNAYIRLDIGLSEGKNLDNGAENVTLMRTGSQTGRISMQNIGTMPFDKNNV